MNGIQETVLLDRLSPKLLLRIDHELRITCFRNKDESTETDRPGNILRK